MTVRFGPEDSGILSRFGDFEVRLHAETCGTSMTHSGRCQLRCECWCHYPDPPRIEEPHQALEAP